MGSLITILGYIATYSGYIAKYGPAVFSALQQGISMVDAIEKQNPQLWPTIKADIEKLFPGIDATAAVNDVGGVLQKHVPTDAWNPAVPR
jgi:hypothetical protein